MKAIQKRARRWLIRHDPDAADFWRSLPVFTDFAAAVFDNIATFGPHRSGSKIADEYERRTAQ